MLVYADKGARQPDRRVAWFWWRCAAGTAAILAKQTVSGAQTSIDSRRSRVLTKLNPTLMEGQMLCDWSPSRIGLGSFIPIQPFPWLG